MGVLKGPIFITLKVPILYYIDQGYLMLFFFVQSDLVNRANGGVTCNTYLRSDWFEPCTLFYLLTYDDRFYLHNTTFFECR